MNRLRLAVLISGTGRSLKNFIEHIDDGRLDAEIPIVVSNSQDAKGLQYAEMHSIPIRIIRAEDYKSTADFSNAMFDCCRLSKVDLVVLAGFVKLLSIPNDFVGKVVNIHPSLIPSFCGKGYYGNRVHSAVITYGAKISGCTVHFVDNEYDNGPIILQKTVPVKEDDTAETLASRVFEMECIAYPEAINLIAKRKTQIVGRRVKISP
ncbi:MAG: phosphoribosylglycinamide formyltransferase [Planctomycetaceae bacterium]|jgi:formyltetrahydrofolate-dependent phosphoribosylglycinamide formyltransferase|nr:phosphoribosylglycinamide formyltransferase [Planctomycetaceae bacterium]